MLLAVVNLTVVARYITGHAGALSGAARDVKRIMKWQICSPERINAGFLAALRPRRMPKYEIKCPLSAFTGVIVLKFITFCRGALATAASRPVRPAPSGYNTSDNKVNFTLQLFGGIFIATSFRLSRKWGVGTRSRTVPSRRVASTFLRSLLNIYHPKCIFPYRRRPVVSARPHVVFFSARARFYFMPRLPLYFSGRVSGRVRSTLGRNFGCRMHNRIDYFIRNGRPGRRVSADTVTARHTWRHAVSRWKLVTTTWRELLAVATRNISYESRDNLTRDKLTQIRKTPMNMPNQPNPTQQISEI